jgi:hypothetical protein
MASCGFDVAVADSRICKRRCDVVDARFELVCGPPVGTLDPGATIPAGQDAAACRSGLSTAGRCSQPCVVDSDCPASMLCGNASTTTCGPDGVGDPDGSTAAFPICRPR